MYNLEDYGFMPLEETIGTEAFLDQLTHLLLRKGESLATLSIPKTNNALTNTLVKDLFKHVKTYIYEIRDIIQKKKIDINKLNLEEGSEKLVPLLKDYLNLESDSGYSYFCIMGEQFYRAFNNGKVLTTEQQCRDLCMAIERPLPIKLYANGIKRIRQKDLLIGLETIISKRFIYIFNKTLVNYAYVVEYMEKPKLLDGKIKFENERFNSYIHELIDYTQKYYQRTKSLHARCAYKGSEFMEAFLKHVLNVVKNYK